MVPVDQHFLILPPLPKCSWAPKNPPAATPRNGVKEYY